MDSLSPKDPFIRLLPQMPISPAVTFHSIVATDKPDAPLEESTDGFVTYHSAHLDGAASGSDSVHAQRAGSAGGHIGDPAGAARASGAAK